jgi:hypothetical protein
MRAFSSSFLSAAATASMAMLVSACGGGGSGGGGGPSIQITVNLVATGTNLQCQTSTPSTYTITRVTDGSTTKGTLPCPSTQAFKGDWTLSRWNVYADSDTSAAPAASTLTQLPAPVPILDGNRWVVYGQSPLTEGRVSDLALQRVDANGEVTAPIAANLQGWVSVPAASVPSSNPTWRWHKRVGDEVFVSAAAKAINFAPTDLDYWGGLSVGDVFANKKPVLAGTQLTDQGLAKVSYASIGLETLLINRKFRDLRFADFNNDGLDDVVSNVYGEGCALIGLQVSAGKYNFFEPKRADGQCIGGFGETLLVADFNGDGWVDILLPSYERFDFLQNQGQGKFVERAAELGIAFPNYVPRVEGAAAADINLDGHIDIVAANEVLINNGKGGFQPRFLPFGVVPVFDEGMSVVDLDNDGLFDIVKHDPTFGPRVFWGQSNRVTFKDSGYFFSGTVTLANSFGFAAGHFTGRSLPDVFMASGDPVGQPPWMCSQLYARKFECMAQAVTNGAKRGADILLVSDIDGDGVPELVSRELSMRIYNSGIKPAHVYRFDVLDDNNRRNRFGTAARAHCVSDDSLLGMGFVDGGNGFLAQGNYTLSFQSSWCASVFLDVARPGGIKRLGPFAPGTHSVKS